MVLQACILTCALRARIIAGVGEVSVSGAVLREGGGSPSLPATAAAAAAAAAVAAVDSRFSGGSIPGEPRLFLVVLDSTPGWSGFDGLQEKHSGRTGSVFHAATSRACSGCALTFFWHSVKKVYWDALYRSALNWQERSSIGPLSSDTSLSATDVIFRPLCLRRLHCCGD